ncbi:hypothetical protein [Actinomadura nitritigenes]|uniref:hypothetical protein n=1 Tax=Actinomadura nitritigenes TaxID=134602 RepID=UPI003D911B6E
MSSPNADQIADGLARFLKLTVNKMIEQEGEARDRLIKDLTGDAARSRPAAPMAAYIEAQGMARPWRSLQQRVDNDGLSYIDAYRAEREQAMQMLLEFAENRHNNGIYNEVEIADRAGARRFLSRTEGLLDQL